MVCVCMCMGMWVIIRTLVYGFYGLFVDQEHSSHQADRSQPAAETQLSADSLVSPFISVRPKKPRHKNCIHTAS